MDLNLKEIFKDSLRQYFSPLVGAFNAIKSEMVRQESKGRAKAVAEALRGD